MKLIVSQLPEEWTERRQKLLISLNDERKAVGVDVQLRAVRHDKSVFLEGTAKAQIELKCSRCLEEVPFPVAIQFATEYEPCLKTPAYREHELSREEIDANCYSDDEIDIEGLIRDNLLLSLPMKPLCADNCRGICLRCGRNLNEGACECSTDEVDPRLEPLKKLRHGREGLVRDEKEDERSRNAKSEEQTLKSKKG